MKSIISMSGVAGLFPAAFRLLGSRRSRARIQASTKVAWCFLSGSSLPVGSLNFGEPMGWQVASPVLPSVNSVAGWSDAR